MQKKTEKTKLRVTELDEYLNKRIDQSEAYTTESVKDMKRIFDEINSDNQTFKKYIITEYVEFFKNKKKIRQEWMVHANDTKKKIDEFI